MTDKMKIGVVCLERTTFDYQAATEIYRRTIGELKADTSVDWAIIETPVIEVEEAIAAGETLARQLVDGVVIISATFHLGHLALTVERLVKRPVLLWAFSELPYDGGKIRLNSVCGINLNASNLYKAGVEGYCCTIGDHIDQDWLAAVRIQTKLRRAHIGLAGYRADGFFNLDVEDLTLARTYGILIDHYELSEFYGGAVESPEYERYIDAHFNTDDITAAQKCKVAALAAGIEGFLKQKKLDAVAVRCWPEFARDYGVAPCASMALLAAKGYILGCEGDMEGTLSLLACKALSDGTPYMADLSQVDFEEDYALMWHCGVAADTLWDGKSVCSLDTYFAGGKGVTTGMVMKEGPVTIFRMDTARGKTRLFIQRGEALPMEKALRGTYAKVRFDRNVRDLFALVADYGVAHHVAMLYGDHLSALRKFARVAGFEVIE